MRKKIMVCCLAFFCVISVLCMDIAARAEVIHENDLEDYIMEQMSAANILGIGISIVSSDKELYCAAYGAAGETEADYVLGALSQSFTAAGIMRMSEDGDLALTDTVSDYLPEYKAVSDVTIEELLYQTSGITMEQKMSDLKAEGKRGDFEFANANYNLLGEIIEKVSGMSYEEYISDNLLDALDMTSTYSLRQDSEASGDLLAGYQNYFGFPYPLKNQYDEGEEWMRPSSGYMISDIKDMGKYLQMYLKEGSDVLLKSDINRMLYEGVAVPEDSIESGSLFEDEGTARYGMGWIEKKVKGQTILYSTGVVENFTALMVLLPEKNLGISMLFNSMDYLVGRKMIQALEEGVIAIELEEAPSKIDSRSYLIQHGVFDAIMLFSVLIALMPIFMLGGWIKRRQKKLIYIPGLIVDVLIQLVLPTVLLVLAESAVPVFLVKRFVPDVYYVSIAVIVSLYLGGLAKIAAGVVLAVLKSKNVQEHMAVESVTEDVQEQSNAADDKKSDQSQDKKLEAGEKPKKSGGEAKEKEDKKKETEEKAKGKREKTEEKKELSGQGKSRAAGEDGVMSAEEQSAENEQEEMVPEEKDTVEVINADRVAGDQEAAEETMEEAGEKPEEVTEESAADHRETEITAVSNAGNEEEAVGNAAEDETGKGEQKEKTAGDKKEQEGTSVETAGNKTREPGKTAAGERKGTGKGAEKPEKGKDTAAAKKKQGKAKPASVKTAAEGNNPRKRRKKSK